MHLILHIYIKPPLNHLTLVFELGRVALMSRG